MERTETITFLCKFSFQRNHQGDSQKLCDFSTVKVTFRSLNLYWQEIDCEIHIIFKEGCTFQHSTKVWLWKKWTKKYSKIFPDGKFRSHGEQEIPIESRIVAINFKRSDNSCLIRFANSNEQLTSVHTIFLNFLKKEVLLWYPDSLYEFICGVRIEEMNNSFSYRLPGHN